MGKKDKKKGKGIEKTAAKTDKKLTAKQKKHLAEIGEDDIESIVAQIEAEERKKQLVKEIIVNPTRRGNFSFAPHPIKEELVLFGGEFFNGQKTVVHNDLFFYNIAKNEWTLVQVPGAPTPRCGHQMITTPTNKGQIWVFGGEFTSTSQNQFYHYKDLWLYSIIEKKWEKLNSPNGPSGRSGHRMVLYKKQIILFGGYHDNLRDYKYYNDVYSFDLENFKWTKLEPSGTPPAPRSGCLMMVLTDGKILIQGGYSKEKVKKDVDKGTVHTDSFLLAPDKNDPTGAKWKWTAVKQSGVKVSARSGMSLAAAAGNRAFAFGGVFDTEENEEDLSGTFYNDLYAVDLESRTWRTVYLTGKKEVQGKRRRRKEKGDGEEGDEEVDEEEMEEEEAAEPTVVVTDGVFTMTVGPSGGAQSSEGPAGEAQGPSVNTPSPRMNCGLAVKQGTLYLYGGLVEDGDKQFTLNDLYALDLKKLDEWRTVIGDEEAKKEWIASDSDSDSDGDEEEDDEEEEEEESEEEPMDTE